MVAENIEKITSVFFTNLYGTTFAERKRLSDGEETDGEEMGSDELFETVFFDVKKNHQPATGCAR